jgi:hypothetical protein
VVANVWVVGLSAANFDAMIQPFPQGLVQVLFLTSLQRIAGFHTESGRTLLLSAQEHVLSLSSYSVAKHQQDRDAGIVSAPGENRQVGTLSCRRRFAMQVPFVASAAAACIGGGLLGNAEEAQAFTISPTGAMLPSEGEIEDAIPKSWNGIDNPFQDYPQKQFSRLDTKPDAIFYAEPRVVEHVDEAAVSKMTEYISTTLLSPGDAVLDLCSSWTSHLPSATKERLKLSSVVGLGMNEAELQANGVLDQYIVQDLNESPVMTKFANESFDVVMCQLSIDYLTKPLDVMREVARILKPGGRVAILFSNRLFLSKVCTRRIALYNTQ